LILATALQWLQLHGCVAKVQRDSVSQSTIENTNDIVVFFAQVVKKDCIGNLAALVRNGSRLRGDRP
jgi:hypothetical protein